MAKGEIEEACTAGRASVIVITNGSRRPIRNVAARRDAGSGEGPRPASRFGEYYDGEYINVAEGSHIDVVRAGNKVGFPFPALMPGVVEHTAETKIEARFTDDAGLHWHIDNELHLRQIKRRDW